MPFATPYDVIVQEPAFRVLRFRRAAPAECREPVLVCFALVNRPYVLDLQPDRSVIGQLLSRGLDVYLVDWNTPTAADRTWGIHDYVAGFLHQAVQQVCQHSGSPQLTLMGYCMGGTMSVLYTALFPPQVRNLVLLAAPIDFGRNEGLLNVWTQEAWLDVDGLIDAFGNCPGEFLQFCFQLTRPVQNFIQKYMVFQERQGESGFVENFLALERWAQDSVPVAGETFREFIKAFYRQNRLVRGDYRLGERAVSLAEISCPLLLLTADLDHLVPPSSTLALTGHVGSADVQHLSLDAGHIGLAVSSKAHQKLWPDVAAWIRTHSTLVPPPTPRFESRPHGPM